MKCITINYGIGPTSFMEDEGGDIASNDGKCISGKYKRVVIVGAGGSGKDYLREVFRTKGWNVDVALTTRPSRPKEHEGISYHYVTDGMFDHLTETGKMYETALFNGYKYGTTRYSWSTSQVFIMTPTGVAQLTPEDRRETFVLYLDINRRARVLRLVERGDIGDTVERRVKADDELFADFTDYTVSLENPKFDAIVLCRIFGKVIEDSPE